MSAAASLAGAHALARRLRVRPRGAAGSGDWNGKTGTAWRLAKAAEAARKWRRSNAFGCMKRPLGDTGESYRMCEALGLSEKPHGRPVGLVEHGAPILD